MNNKVIIGVSFFVFCLLRAGAATAAPTASALDRAEQAFASGRYPDAQKFFKGIAADKMTGSDDLARWNILCARIAFAADDRVESERCLRDALKLKPDQTFDPYMDQPPFIALWKTISAEFQTAVASPTETVKDVHLPPTSATSIRDSKPTTPFKRSVRAAFSLFPFGVGSFVNDEVMEGTLFASLNLLAIAAPTAGTNCCGEMMLLVLPGVWGYEWAENVPRFGQEFPRAARVIDNFMPFFPFGAAQLRNGHDRKALTLASTQLAFVMVISSGLNQQEREWDRYRDENYFIGSSSAVSSSKSESESGSRTETKNGNALSGSRRDYSSISSWQNALLRPNGYELVTIGWVGFLSSYAFGLYDGWYYHSDDELKSPNILKKLRLVPAVVTGQQSAYVVPQLEVQF